VSIPPVFDAHIHVQPWHMLHEAVRDRLWHGRAGVERLLETARDPAKLLRFLDAEGIEQAVLVNYVSPDVMGFTHEANPWIGNYVRGHEDRLVAMGSVHPRHTENAAEEVARLVEMGIRALKLHPPHQLVRPNAYLDGLETRGLGEPPRSFPGRATALPTRWRSTTLPATSPTCASSSRTAADHSSWTPRSFSCGAIPTCGWT
jgi:hypothetical protein